MNPKLFVSYSWTTPEHEAWVVGLASELRESGVDVVLDKWDLKEGHDAHAFMEQMVTDSDIKKVILVCDRAYAQKADKRSGGVGTEAQIITPEIYNKQNQSKFVAVVKERDDQGHPYLPTYYKSRIYIDLSEAGNYAQNFEQLLRWIYDQPLHIKPDLGKKPAFLLESEGSIRLATGARWRRAMDAVKTVKDYAVPAVAEYLSVFSDEIEKFRLNIEVEFPDEEFIKNIESFIPYRDEYIQLIEMIAMYDDADDMRTKLHRFFERLIPYLDRPESVNSWQDWNFDNYRFTIHEMYLYTVSCFIKHERFQSAAYFIENDYYVPGNSEFGRNNMVPYLTFSRGVELLSHRNRRLNLRKLSLRANLLKERCKGLGIEFRHLMEADFVLFLRSQLHPHNYHLWWPETLIYVGNHTQSPFEIFARSKSKRYFDNMKTLLGITTKDDLKALMEKFRADPRSLPSWEFIRPSPYHLTGFELLASQP